jgi:Ca2+-binding EF-hand superfamily protein
MGLFGEEEIRNIFNLFDLKNDGFIAKDQCKEALKTLANSEFQVSEIENATIKDRVDCA